MPLTNPHNGKKYILYTIEDMNLDAIDKYYIDVDSVDTSLSKKKIPPHTKRELEWFVEMDRQRHHKL